jgi:hypothetical protein
VLENLFKAQGGTVVCATDLAIFRAGPDGLQDAPDEVGRDRGLGAEDAASPVYSSIVRDTIITDVQIYSNKSVYLWF